MKKINKILSFILTLVILLGSTSALAYSKQSIEEGGEINYEIKTIDGITYKIYKFNDLFPEEEVSYKTRVLSTRSADNKDQDLHKKVESTTSKSNELVTEDNINSTFVSDGTSTIDTNQELAEGVEESAMKSENADLEDEVKYKIGNIDISEEVDQEIVGATAKGEAKQKDDDILEYTGVVVNWSSKLLTLLTPNDILQEGIYFEILDITSNKTIAKTDNISAAGEYKFYKTQDFDSPDVSKDRNDWYFIVPDSINFDVRLKHSESGSSLARVQVGFALVAMPLYKVEFYTNQNQNPTITVMHNDSNDRLGNKKEISENIEPDEYYSLIPKSKSDNYYKGKKITIVGETGNENNISRAADSLNGASRYYMVIKAGDMPDFDDPSYNKERFKKEETANGSFIDNKIAYHYQVTGDYKTPYIATIRQELKVKFDPNGGTWKDTNNDELKEYPFAHSMTLGQSWGDIKAITPPGKDHLTPPETNPGEPEKEFKGWSRSEQGTVIDDMSSELITENTTFYAIYDDTAQGSVNIEYVDENGDKISDENKIDNQDYNDTKSGTLGKVITEDDFSKNNAPQFKNYIINEVKIPENSTYKDNNQDTITYVYKLKDTCLAIYVDSSSQEYEEFKDGVFVDRQYIKGTVLDVGNKKPSKEILKDATVIIVDADGDPIKDRDGSNIPAAKVKDDGTFEFTISQKGVEKLKLDHNNTIYFAVECKENGSAKPKGQAELTLDLQAPSLTKVN